MADTQNKQNSQATLLKEYEERLTPEEAWEEATATKEDPRNILATGEDARQQIAKYEWDSNPQLWKILLDPRRVPCLRETMMTGIVGGFFGLGISAIARGVLPILKDSNY